MEVIFYKLSSKFVDSSKEVPEASQELVYYSLAVGHHTGVIDCLSEAFRCDLADYRALCAHFAHNEQAHYKLAGVERNGEIQIDRSHLPLFAEPLAEPIDAPADAAPTADARTVLTVFEQLLNDLRAHQGMYLMVRLS